jgi:hypothetical protein
MENSDQNQRIPLLFWCIFGILAIGLAPFIVAWKMTPPDKVFSGALINPDDLSVYLSAIRQGIEGKWLFSFAFSPEAMQSRFTYPLYIGLGYLISLFGGEPLYWFHGFRLLCGILTIIALYYWVRLIFPENGKIQKTALILLSFGSGIGWILTPIIPVDSLLLTDINIPEWGLATALMSSPHFILGIGLEVLLVGILIRNEEVETSKTLILLGVLSAIGIGLAYPFHIPTLGLITSVYLVWIAISEKRIDWKHWLTTILILTPFLLYLLYYGITALTDPLWETSHVQNNLIEPPPPLGLVIGSGLLGVFAVLGIKTWFRQNRTPLIPIWAAVNALIIYLPIPFSGRFVLGLIIPIATMAAFSLEEVILPSLRETGFFLRFSKLTPTPLETLRRVFIILTLPTTLLISLWLIRNSITTKDFPLYFPTDEILAVEWLGENGNEEDVVLAYYPMGNYMPRDITGKVFLGHLNLTIDLNNKIEAIEKFWDVGTSQEWRENFLEAWDITMIYQGKYEKLLSEDVVIPPGKVVYKNDTVTIYTTP